MQFNCERATKTGESVKVGFKLNLLHLVGLLKFIDYIRLFFDGLSF